MGKQLLAVIGGLLIFWFMFSILSNKKLKPTGITIDLETITLENDIFYIYYLQEGVKKWSDENSVHQRIQGSEAFQNLQFELPIDKPINRIRVDIGANKKQKPIVLKSITISSETGSITISNDLLNSFDLNAYATLKDNLFSPKIVNDRYDPFLISKLVISEAIENLRKPKQQFNSTLIYFISILFSLSFYVFLINKKIEFQLNHVYIFLFVLIIVSPFLFQIFSNQNEKVSLEKRELAKMPEFTSVEKFPQEFENYFNDNFGLRNEMIDLFGRIKVNVFKSSPKPERVQFGSNKFLFYNNIDDEVFGSYTNTAPISPENLNRMFTKFASRRDLLNKEDITYVVGFWPNKHTIYPEFLPASMQLQIIGKISQADRIIDYFRNKDFDFFDVRKPLTAAKDNKNLYRTLDTHWNANGAYEAYRGFCQVTHATLGLTPFNISDFQIKYNDSYEGDLTNQLGVKSIYGYKDNLPTYDLIDKTKLYKTVVREGFPKGTIITQNDNSPKKQKALIFRDSFTTALVQFISLHYKEVIYINGIYDQSIVDKVKPDVVISCRVERYMLSM